MQHNGHGGSVTGLFAVAFIMVYVAGFEVGLGPIPWAIGTEVFEESERATAMGMSQSCEGGLLLALTVPIATQASGRV